MASYRDYLVALSPWWLDAYNQNGRLFAYGDVFDSLYNDAIAAAVNSRVAECDPSCLDALGNNFNLSRITGETDEHFRKNLLDAWNVWKKSGSDQGIIEALQRAGAQAVQIIHWQTLMDRGVPKAFGGGYHTILGGDANGHVRYVSLKTANVVVQHIVSAHSQLSMTVSEGDPLTIVVQLQGDAAGVSISTANDVIELFRFSRTSEKYGVYCNASGTGQGISGTGTVVLDLPIYTHFFIEIDTPNQFFPPLRWDQNFENLPWSLENPVATTLRAISGRYAEYINIVGDNGVILNYTGSGWATITTGTTQNLNAISTQGLFVGGLVVGDNGTAFFGVESVFTPTTTGAAGINLNCCYYIDSNHAWAAGDTGTILHYVSGTWSFVTFGGMPTANYRGMLGFSDTDIWIVGDSNTVVHYDGATWTVVTGPIPGGNLLSIAGLSTDFWFVTDDSGLIYPWSTHFDAYLLSGNTNALNGSVYIADGAVYFVGDGGKINQFDYNVSPQPLLNSGTSANLYGIWGDADNNDLWAVGQNGTIIHRQRAAMTPAIIATGAALSCVWTNNPADAWAAGVQGRVMHYDGNSWSDTPGVPIYDVSIHALWSFDGTQVWTVGNNGFIASRVGASYLADFSYSGTATLYALSGSALNDAWCVGSNGTILHWDGSTWSLVDSGTSNDLYGVCAYNRSLAYAVGQEGVILKWDGGTWKPQHSPTALDLTAISCAGAVPVAVGAGGVIVRSVGGLQWSVDLSPVVTDLTGIALENTGQGWAVGETGTLLRYDGTSWNIVTPPVVADFTAIWELPNGHVSVVGKSGHIIFYNGATWATQASGVTYDLQAVWGASDTAIYAAGTNSPTLFYNGSWANDSQIQIKANLTAIFALAIDNMWICGERGTLLHYDGIQFTPISVGTDAGLTGLWAAASDNIYACGQDGSGGVVLHYDGIRWTEVLRIAGNTTLTGIWGSGPGDIWVSGYTTPSTGLLYHFNGTTWSAATLPAGTTAVFAVKGYDSRNIWAAAENNSTGLGRVLYYDGTSWNMFAPPSSLSTHRFTSFAVVGPNSFWATGTNGILYFWNGYSWLTYVYNQAYVLTGVAIAVGAPPFVVGFNSILAPDQSGVILQLFADADKNIWDGGGVWDLGAKSIALLRDFIALVRKFKCEGTSCRFFRINVAGEWVTIPVGELVEIDINGNYTTPEPSYLLGW